MAPKYRIAKPRKIGGQVTKRTIKFLACQSDPRVQRAVLNGAHDSVYKSICNAFFNLAQNPEITISSKKNKNLFKKHHQRISQLIRPNISIRTKKKLIQTGGSPFLAAVIPAVLSSAISLLGSAFLTKK